MNFDVKRICILRRHGHPDSIAVEIKGSPNFPAIPESGCWLQTETVRGGAESWLNALGFDMSIVELVVQK